jgi:phenylacetic acid degradation operon negative regulatory protein
VLRVPEERREVRHRMRTQLAWAGFGSLGGGLWISPHVERERELAGAGDAGSGAELVSFHGGLGALGDPARVIADAWDLDAVADAYRAFAARFGRMSPRGAEAVFRAQTLLVHEWRKFPFLDPDLPDGMLPARWPRRRAHDLFHEKHAAWQDDARAWFAGLDRGGERTAA